MLAHRGSTVSSAHGHGTQGCQCRLLLAPPGHQAFWLHERKLRNKAPIYAPSGAHVLTTRAYEYGSLHGKRDFTNVIQVKALKIGR